jgi:hypothetical protein
MTFEEFANAILSLDDKELAQMIERRHPFYDGMLPHWNFLEATYEGGREWFESNLFKFHKEGKKEFEDRRERAYRPNHTREVVDLVNKYIFKATIARNSDDAPQHVKDFWKSATLQRGEIDDYMQLVSKKTSIYGLVWVVVDSLVPEGVLMPTVADVKDGNARVYSYLVKPQHALDMAFDQGGELDWIMIQETYRDANLFGGTGAVEPRYRLWTRDFWALFEEYRDRKGGKKKYRVIDLGEHGVGVVPVFPAYHVVSEEQYWATGLIDDVAYMDRAVANYLSNIDAIIQDQTFSQLVIPAQAIAPGDEGEDKVLEMGTKRMFTYDAQAGVAPQFISPDPRQAGLILAIINKIISEIYQTVGMAGERTKEDNAMGIDNSSGVAKAYDFERMNALLASKASSLETVENRLVAVVRLYHSDGKPDEIMRDDANKLVTYPGNFDVRSLYDEFEIANQLTLIVAPDKVRQQQMIALVDKLFPGIGKKLVEEIKKDVQTNWPPEPPVVTPAPGGPSSAPKPKTQNKQGQNNKDVKAK